MVMHQFRNTHQAHHLLRAYLRIIHLRDDVRSRIFEILFIKFVFNSVAATEWVPSMNTDSQIVKITLWAVDDVDVLHVVKPGNFRISWQVLTLPKHCK